jgi:ATP-independent RNA helicase DbpA
MLFSATYQDDIRAASAPFLCDPVEVRVTAHHEAERIEQRFYEIGFDQRDAATAALLRHEQPVSALAFCNTKVRCRELAEHLRAQGFSALALYGELEQRERDEILELFANRSCSVLVATDVAARGLDISSLDAVINVDVPRDAEVYVHRIGRTGRGDATGLALTLCAANEKKWVNLIGELQQQPIAWHALPAQEAAPEPAPPAPMRTLCIMGGKRHKLRPAAVLGALTVSAGLTREQVGKISVFEFSTYVAIERRAATQAWERLSAACPPDFGSFKGRRFKKRFIDV